MLNGRFWRAPPASIELLLARLGYGEKISLASSSRFHTKEPIWVDYWNYKLLVYTNIIVTQLLHAALALEEWASAGAGGSEKAIGRGEWRGVCGEWGERACRVSCSVFDENLDSAGEKEILNNYGSVWLALARSIPHYERLSSFFRLSNVMHSFADVGQMTASAANGRDGSQSMLLLLLLLLLLLPRPLLPLLLLPLLQSHGGSNIDYPILLWSIRSASFHCLSLAGVESDNMLSCRIHTPVIQVAEELKLCRCNGRPPANYNVWHALTKMKHAIGEPAQETPPCARSTAVTDDTEIDFVIENIIRNLLLPRCEGLYWLD